MSQTHNVCLLPTIGDVEALLKAACLCADERYSSPEFSTVHSSLQNLFNYAIEECVTNGGNREPVEILLECIQDERSCLEHHNRRQARALYRQETINEVTNDLDNFPLRSIVVNRGIKLPTKGLDPLPQVVDDPDNIRRAREARENAYAAIVKPEASALPRSKHTPSKQSAKMADPAAETKQDKLYDAPSPEHDFPDGNVTLAEIAAFLPQSFKCWDIIDRVIWNGATTGDITALINKYRTMPNGDIVNNTVYRMMRGQMNKRGKEDRDYQKWTVGGHADIEKPSDFNPSSVSVTGFRRPVVSKDQSDEPADPIPFKDLAEGVEIMPKHKDALDLTRCVSYCVANPDEEWYYPTDFQRLLKECLGGPVTVHPDHGDAQVLLRLRSETAPVKRRHTKKNSSKEESEDSVDEVDTNMGKHKHSTTSTGESGNHLRVPNKHKKTTEKSSDTSQARRKSTRRIMPQESSFNFMNFDSENDTDDGAYCGPKRTKKNKAAPRRSAREKRKVSYAINDVQVDDNEEDKEDDEVGEDPDEDEDVADVVEDKMDEDED